VKGNLDYPYELQCRKNYLEELVYKIIINIFKQKNIQNNMDNEPLSSLTHLIGLILSVSGLILLVVFGAINGSVWHVVSFSIFGSSLILLYLASTLYHFIPKSSPAKKIFQKIDHSMIYVLIAGTYTPICLVALKGGIGWSIFGIIWGLAVFGILLKIFVKKINQKFSTALYLIMGWIVLFAFYSITKNIETIGVWWLIAGGIFYTIGVIFFALDKIVPRTKWLGMHEIFHLFIIAGSYSHFWLMFKYIH